jgi:hypothetical protein
VKCICHFVSQMILYLGPLLQWAETENIRTVPECFFQYPFFQSTFFKYRPIYFQKSILKIKPKRGQIRPRLFNKGLAINEQT